VVKIKKKV